MYTLIVPWYVWLVSYKIIFCTYMACCVGKSCIVWTKKSPLTHNSWPDLGTTLLSWSASVKVVLGANTFFYYVMAITGPWCNKSGNENAAVNLALISPRWLYTPVRDEIMGDLLSRERKSWEVKSENLDYNNTCVRTLKLTVMG